MNDSSIRWRVHQLAATDTEAALKLSRKIENPWYRAQSLAAVAQYAPGSKVESISREAFKSASECEDAYQIVAVSGWPLGALVARDRRRFALDMLAGILAKSASIESIVNRSDALYTVFRFAYPLDREAWQPIVDELGWCASQKSSWRCARNLSNVIGWVANKDAEYAQKLVMMMLDSKYKNIAIRELKCLTNPSKVRWL